MTVTRPQQVARKRVLVLVLWQTRWGVKVIRPGARRTPHPLLRPSNLGLWSACLGAHHLTGMGGTYPELEPLMLQASPGKTMSRRRGMLRCAPPGNRPASSREPEWTAGRAANPALPAQGNLSGKNDRLVLRYTSTTCRENLHAVVIQRAGACSNYLLKCMDFVTRVMAGRVITAEVKHRADYWADSEACNEQQMWMNGWTVLETHATLHYHHFPLLLHITVDLIRSRRAADYFNMLCTTSVMLPVAVHCNGSAGAFSWWTCGNSFNDQKHLFLKAPLSVLRILISVSVQLQTGVCVVFIREFFSFFFFW